jgi:transcriptional antiterminator RfaH
MSSIDSVADKPLAENWYVIHTRPRQEQRALSNLQQQGYQCYLPLIPIEKLIQKRVSVIEEPLFPRYLFICLDAGRHGQNWSPIRSTWGVSGLVTFGSTPASVDNSLIDFMRRQEQGYSQEPERLFAQGESLYVADGPFSGVEAVYQMPSGDNRALVLIELMGKSVQMQIAPASLRKLTKKSVT